MTETDGCADNLSKMHKNSAKICETEIIFVPLQRFSMEGERINGDLKLRYREK